MNVPRSVLMPSRLHRTAQVATLVALGMLSSACQAQPAPGAQGLRPLPTVSGASAPQVPVMPALSPGKKAEVMALFDAKTGMKSTDANPSPIPGFFEVVVMANVYYMDANGKHLFDGHLVDLDTRTSITAARKASLQATAFPALDWRKLDLNDAIKVSKGNATPGRVLVTFEDPNCGFCKKLHAELNKIQNLTVYVFPISFLGPQSQAINQSIWCAKDRAAEWNKALSGGAYTPTPGVAGCDTSALSRNGELARRLGVQGTPTMYLADGSRIPGYMSAEALEAKLSTQQNR